MMGVTAPFTIFPPPPNLSGQNDVWNAMCLHIKLEEIKKTWKIKETPQKFNRSDF